MTKTRSSYRITQTHLADSGIPYADGEPPASGWRRVLWCWGIIAVPFFGFGALETNQPIALAELYSLAKPDVPGARERAPTDDIHARN